MTSDRPSTDDRAFPELALEAFGFLIAMGFRVARSEDRLIRLESDLVYVNVYYGRSSYQVGVELGRLDRVELYALYEVLSAFAPADASLAGLQAVEPDVVDRCLRKVAAVLERHCRDLLAGDDGAFVTLHSTASRLRESATISAQFGAIVDRADQAWTDGDRSRAADLYASAAPALDEIRRKRLAHVRGKQAAR
jgi:hypothetical protein